MTTFGLTLIGFWAANALAAVALIGRPRPAITPFGATLMVAFYGALIAITVAVGA